MEEREEGDLREIGPEEEVSEDEGGEQEAGEQTCADEGPEERVSQEVVYALFEVQVWLAVVAFSRRKRLLFMWKRV